MHADGAHLNILGQQLDGNFTFEQVTTPAANGAPATKIVKVGATNVGIFVGDQAAGAGVQVSGATALFVIRPAGIAGSVTGGTIHVLVPGDVATFTGTFSLAINTTNQAVSEQLVVGGQSVSLTLPSGPYLRVEGDNIELAFAGQRLTGSFAFESATEGTTKVTRVLVTGVSAAFGDGTNNFVTMSGGSGFFLLRQEGLAGSLGGTVGGDDPRRLAHRHVRARGQHVDRGHPDQHDDQLRPGARHGQRGRARRRQRRRQGGPRRGHERQRHPDLVQRRRRQPVRRHPGDPRREHRQHQLDRARRH